MCEAGRRGGRETAMGATTTHRPIEDTDVARQAFLAATEASDLYVRERTLCARPCAFSVFRSSFRHEFVQTLILLTNNPIQTNTHPAVCSPFGYFFPNASNKQHTTKNTVHKTSN